MSIRTCIAVINEKGGTAKTTTSVNLSAALGEQGQRVLLVDLDGQAASSRWVGVEEDNRLAEAMGRGGGLKPIPNVMPNVSLVPASGRLDSVAHDLRPTQGGQLRKILSEISNDFDYTIIDCPPSLGNRLIANGLLAATHVVVPVETSILALDGLKILLTTLEDVRDGFGHDLVLAGVLACRYDGRTKLSRLVLDELRRALPGRVFNTVIRENVRMRECPASGQSILAFAPDSPAAADYRMFAKELLTPPQAWRQAAAAAQGDHSVDNLRSNAAASVIESVRKGKSDDDHSPLPEGVPQAAASMDEQTPDAIATVEIAQPAIAIDATATVPQVTEPAAAEAVATPQQETIAEPAAPQTTTPNLDDPSLDTPQPDPATSARELEKWLEQLAEAERRIQMEKQQADAPAAQSEPDQATAAVTVGAFPREGSAMTADPVAAPPAVPAIPQDDLTITLTVPQEPVVTAPAAAAVDVPAPPEADSASDSAGLSMMEILAGVANEPAPVSGDAEHDGPAAPADAVPVEVANDLPWQVHAIVAEPAATPEATLEPLAETAAEPVTEPAVEPATQPEPYVLELTEQDQVQPPQPTAPDGQDTQDFPALRAYLKQMQQEGRLPQQQAAGPTDTKKSGGFRSLFRKVVGAK